MRTLQAKVEKKREKSKAFKQMYMQKEEENNDVHTKFGNSQQALQ